MGSAYLRIGVLLHEIVTYLSGRTLIVGRLMGKYSSHKNPPLRLAGDQFLNFNLLNPASLYS